MKAVLKCRLSSGEELNVTPGMFSLVKFKDSTVISGDKYYIDKAVSLGAIAPPKPKKKKAK